jgi:hypothetical protein
MTDYLALAERLENEAGEESSSLGAHIQEGGEPYELPPHVALLLEAATALREAHAEIERLRALLREARGFVDWHDCPGRNDLLPRIDKELGDKP